MKPSTKAQILALIAQFRAEDAKASKHLQKLADAAERSGDYSDYDEANADYWQYGNDAGWRVVHEIEALLK